jgi:hypothetical protein
VTAPQGSPLPQHTKKSRDNSSTDHKKRFERYGVLTGLVDDSLLEKLRHTPNVRSVEVDKERFLR